MRLVYFNARIALRVPDDQPDPQEELLAETLNDSDAFDGYVVDDVQVSRDE